MANPYDWSKRFLEIYDHAVGRYDKGAKTPEDTLAKDETSWLAEIGCTSRELFDFVEDYCRSGKSDPDPGIALILAEMRRDYFLNVQHGERAAELPSSTLPPKSEAVEGIEWLPRLIEKAKRKLRGQMDDDLMYGCGGDRGFCRRFQMHLGEFLKLVRDADGNDRKVIDYMVDRAKKLKML